MNNILHMEGEMLRIKGATKVISSTQSQAAVETKECLIVVSGSEIEVKRLNLDEEDIELKGKVSSIKFSPLGAKKQPLLKRIFK